MESRDLAARAAKQTIDVPSSRILHSRRSRFESSSRSLSILLLLFRCSDSSPLVLMHDPIVTMNLRGRSLRVLDEVAGDNRLAVERLAAAVSAAAAAEKARRRVAAAGDVGARLSLDFP